MRIALVHDFLSQLGGAERVLDAFLGIWPDAPVYTLIYDPIKTEGRYRATEIRESFVGRLPFGRTNYHWYLPLMTPAIESFDLASFDVVLSDSSAFAKGVRVPRHIPHVSYIHTPTRYLWMVERDYLGKNAPAWVRPAARRYLKKLRQWDRRAAQRPSFMIANSRTVRERIQTYYHRDADAILYPPVDTELFRPALTHDDYWLVVSRQEYYKRTDLAIEAARLAKVKLKIVGVGREAAQLKQGMNQEIEFYGRVSDRVLAKLFAHARGFLFPAEEDAGIVPLEAMAAGRPVLAYGKGGVRETVIAGKTGEFFAVQDPRHLANALLKFDPDRYDTKEIRERAQEFSLKEFQRQIRNYVETALERKLRTRR